MRAGRGGWRARAVPRPPACLRREVREAPAVPGAVAGGPGRQRAHAAHHAGGRLRLRVLRDVEFGGGRDPGGPRGPGGPPGRRPRPRRRARSLRRAREPELLPAPVGGAWPGAAGEGKGPPRRARRRLGRRLEEVAEAVGGGCCRLRMPLKPAVGVRGTVAGHRVGALEVTPPPSSSASLACAPPPPGPGPLPLRKGCMNANKPARLDRGGGGARAKHLNFHMFASLRAALWDCLFCG